MERSSNGHLHAALRFAGNGHLHTALHFARNVIGVTFQKSPSSKEFVANFAAKGMVQEIGLMHEPPRDAIEEKACGQSKMTWDFKCPKKSYKHDTIFLDSFVQTKLSNLELPLKYSNRGILKSHLCQLPLGYIHLS